MQRTAPILLRGAAAAPFLLSRFNHANRSFVAPGKLSVNVTAVNARHSYCSAALHCSLRNYTSLPKANNNNNNVNDIVHNSKSSNSVVAPSLQETGLVKSTLPLYMRAAGGGNRGPGNDYIKHQDSVSYNNNNSGGGGGDDVMTPYVRAHLTRVYGLLACAVLAAGGGAALMIATPLAKTIPFWLPMVGGFVPLLWLSFAPPANPNLKLGLFFAFAVLEGMGLAPLILFTSMKGVLVTSLVLTFAVFAGFSSAAFLAPRASLVAWQGPLYGMLLGLVGISLLNIFYPTAIAHSLILYGGLALFSVMVAVDTQAMVERARCGVGDHVQDALQMFLNVVNIFVRIAQIMGGQDS